METVKPTVPQTDEQQQMEASERHFKWTYIYIWLITFLVVGYIFIVTLFKLPDSASHIVDIVLGYLLGLLTMAANYLFGTNPTATTKKTTTANTDTGNISVTSATQESK